MTADEVLSLLMKRYSNELRYACASEVPSRTGFGDRRFDFVVINCWKSDGFRVDVFEIKVSKADLRHELENPEKHNWAFDDIDRYWLACPEEIVDIDIVPKMWGIIVVRNGELVVKRKPIPLNDDQEHSRTMNRTWAISLMRAVSRSSVEKSKQERQIREARNEGYDNGYKDGFAKGAGFNPDQYIWKENFCRGMGAYCERDASRIVDDWDKLRPLVWSKDFLKSNLESLERNLRDLKKTFNNLFENNGAKISDSESEVAKCTGR